MALFGRTSLPILKKDPERCTKCRICTRVCPLDHDRVYDDMENDDVSTSIEVPSIKMNFHTIKIAQKDTYAFVEQYDKSINGIDEAIKVL